METPTSAAAVGSRSVPAAVVVIQVAIHVVQLMSLLPWLVFSGLAVMAFDAPGSMGLWQPWVFVLGIWSYPAWLASGAVVSWVLIAKNRFAAGILANIVLSLPVPVALLIFVMVV